MPDRKKLDWKLARNHRRLIPCSEGWMPLLQARNGIHPGMPSPGRKPLSGRIASTKRDRQGRRLPGFRSSVLLGLAFVLLLASLIFVYLQLPKDNDGDLKFKAQV